MQKEIIDIIVKYGRNILCSDVFEGAFLQKHHFNSTVGDHTLGVTAEAVKICLKRGLTDDDTLRVVVTASLCHDLGILGRGDKFRNNAQCLIQHPIDSIERYKEITQEEDEKVIDSIACHMFPLKLQMPGYKEGWILTLADKKGSFREKIGHPSVTAEDRKRILKAAGDRRINAA